MIFDALPGDGEQRGIFRQHCGGGVAEIREQREVQVLVPMARKRTSSASMRPSTAPEFASMVGTTTSVRESAGIPAEKSMRGSMRGVASSVTSQFHQRHRELTGGDNRQHGECAEDP